MEAKGESAQTEGPITIEGKNFDLVKTRQHMPVSVYGNKESYLRIGPKDLIEQEVKLHKELLKFGFPVPQILAEGEENGKYYYIESSLGENLLGNIFFEDFKEKGAASPEHFEKFLALVQKFGEAQLKTATPQKDVKAFFKGIHTDFLEEEMPQLKDKIHRALQKLEKRTHALPAVLTHGDFNPYNLFEKGVIDFGSSFYAPAGYDLITGLYHIYNFPSEKEHINARRFDFTPEQREKYLSTIDLLYTNNKLPQISTFKNDFIFARSVWSVVRMDHLPQLKEWRFKQFEQMLDEYLADKDIAAIVTGR